MPALKLIKLGKSLNCGISLSNLSKLKATSRWAPFSQAFMPALKQITLGRSLNCGISLSKLQTTSH
jgi:hypothetical protein